MTTLGLVGVVLALAMVALVAAAEVWRYRLARRRRDFEDELAGRRRERETARRRREQA